MKNAARPFLTFTLALAGLASVSVRAAEILDREPSNANMSLRSGYSEDGAVGAVAGHVFQHLYGRDLVLTLAVRNLDWRKQISIVNDASGERWEAEYAGADFWRYNAAAEWAGRNAEGEDLIVIRVKGFQGGSANRYSVYVTMNGLTHVARDLRVAP